MKDEVFDNYIEEIKSIHENNPVKVNRELHELLHRIRNNDDDKKSILSDLEMDKLLLCIIIILIILLGLLNIGGGETAILYFVGVAFFLAGIFIGLYLKGFGLIFLFSHGIAGLCLMEGSFISNITDNPLISENPTNIYIFLGLSIILFAIATIMIVIHNLSDLAKEKMFYKVIPFILYFIGLLISGILPYIINFIY